MTNWDQLDAMGDLARLNQQKALAREQAARDAQLARQNAEVVRLLQEQKDREDAERARKESMPKCPDCRSPVEVDSRRCPHCRSEILTWDYVHPTYACRIICRAAEAPNVLQARCDALLTHIERKRSEFQSALGPIDQSWLARFRKASSLLRDKVRAYNAQSQPMIADLLVQTRLGGRFATAKDQASLLEMRQRIDSDYPDQPMGDSRAAKKAKRQRKDATSMVGCMAILLVLIGGFLAIDGWRSYKHMSAIHGEGAENSRAYFTWAIFGSILAATGLAAIAYNAIRSTVERIAEAHAARRAASVQHAREAALSEYESKAQAIDLALRNKLKQAGILAAHDAFVSLSNQAASAAKKGNACLDEIATTLHALADSLEFGMANKIDLHALAGKPPTAVHSLAVRLLDTPCSDPIYFDLEGGDIRQGTSLCAAIETTLKVLGEMGFSGKAAAQG